MEEFEKKYESLVIEKKIQNYWNESNLYDFKTDASRPVYSIDTPPPTVNGSLHIGHIFSYTQAEMIARYRRMNGYNVFYPFGFDDNGLPSERLVERENNIKARQVSRSEFCDMCIKTTQKYEDEFKALWKSLGFSCDWNLQYSTVSPQVQKISQKLFLELAKKNIAYIKESPVLWCTECQTSIAQAELETKEIASHFHYIPFLVEGEILEVATTRPELLYGVVCVFVNPDDDRYRKYIGKMVKVPLYNFEVPILSDSKVGIDKGTGVVMCATFGDTTDVEWYNQYNLPYKKVILPNGFIDENVPFIGGLYVKKARKVIVDLLNESNLLIRSEELKHMVAVHERCGTEIEIIPSRQWYINVLNKKDELLEAGDKIKWYPAAMKNRYVTWVENLKWDWCVSRQRYFGIPFPVWYCKQCGKPHFATEEQLPVNPIEVDFKDVCECGGKEFIPESAVLDTWATSSISPMINENTFKRYGSDNIMPMSMRTQAHEIIRTWAFYTIVRSLYHNKTIPWDDIMICGFVLAKPGEKISKSKSNSKLTPQALIEEYGADAIRYWSASTRLGTDTFFDQQDMQDSSKRVMNKLWNSSKFVLSHLQDFDPEYQPKLLPIDQWIIEKTKSTIGMAQKFLNEYEIGLARKIIDELFWKYLCDNYIEIVKERLYRPDIHGIEERKSAQFSAYYCLLSILKMYAIYIPHETEYIYLKGFKDFVGVKSIHLLQWDIVQDINESVLEFGEEVIRNISEVRKQKSENNMSIKDEIDVVIFRGSEKFADYFRQTEQDFISCMHTKKVEYQLL